MNIEDAVSKIMADGATGKTLNEAANKAANKFISIKRLGGEVEL